jgi:hypothetical protein
MSALSTSHLHVGSARTRDSGHAQSGLFAEGTRTGDWFAVGDVHPEIAPPSIAPPPLPAAGRSRRNLARLVGIVAIAGTLACLVRFATYAPVRRAILQWGFFGKSDRVLTIGKH